PNPGYRLIRIENDSVHVYERDFNKQTLTRVLARSLHPASRPSVSISTPAPNAVVSNELQLVCTVPDSVPVHYRLSDAPWLPLENHAGKIQQTISLEPFPDGQHWLQIQVTFDSLNTWRQQIPVTIARENPTVAWRKKFDDEAQAAGCIWQDKLFLPSNSGTLRCLNIHDGSMAREISLPGSIVTIPVVHADTLFVTTTDGVGAAISPTTGAIFWQEKYADGIFSSPVWYENRLYFGTSDNNVIAINSGDGKVSWEFTTGKHVKCRLACDAGTVVFGSWDGYFYGVDAGNGNLKWQQQISANPYFPAATSNPLIHDGIVFVSSHDHAVHAFAVDSGHRLWKHEKTPNQFGGYSSPAWWCGNLVFGSLSGHVFLLNAKTGQSVGTIALNSAEDPIFDSSPLIADNRCFVGS
ncbi:PQQ-like beta-propeller repeat protein, partial [bacterium]|nr:PQQ-like beta-propeller repeat protein [bacterium]